MRHTVVKDYELIEKELKKLRKESNIDGDVIRHPEIYAINGHSSNHTFSIRCDAQVLAAQLIKYFELTSKNFKFESFYEKKFMDLFKALVKDEEDFKKFLEIIGLDPVTNILLIKGAVPGPSKGILKISNAIKPKVEHYDFVAANPNAKKVDEKELKSESHEAAEEQRQEEAKPDKVAQKQAELEAEKAKKE
jgi:hypothetical protein